MSNGNVNKVTLQELANALAEVARWTQAIDAELATFKGGQPSVKEALQDAMDAVASAVEYTAIAAAKANVANETLMNYGTSTPSPADLATNKQDAGTKVRSFADTTVLNAALVGRGC